MSGTGGTSAGSTAPRRARPELAEQRFPLSSTQQVFCSDERHFTDRFIVVYGWRVAGSIETETLRAALADLVERHENLRVLVVRDEDGEAYQRIAPPCPVPLLVSQVAPFTGRSREVRAEELLIEAEAGRLDPRELPLIRAQLHRFDERDCVFILVHHHFGMDGWSVGVAIRDLAELYSARAAGRAPQLPEAPQFREYALWQRSRGGGAENAEAARTRAYWEERLEGVEIFTLPADRPMPAAYSQPYTEGVFEYDAVFAAALSELARRERCSLFMLLLAGLAVLAHEIRGTTDATFHTLTTGRNEERFQQTVGLFIDFLPLRVRFGDCASFREVLGRARAACVGAFAHEIPMSEIRRLHPGLMAPTRDPMHCFMNLVFHEQPTVGQTYPLGEGAVEIRERELEHPETGDMPFGSSWNMELLPSGRLGGGLLHNPDEFDPGTVARWTGLYRRILEAAVQDPARAWRELARGARA